MVYDHDHWSVWDLGIRAWGGGACPFSNSTLFFGGITHFQSFKAIFTLVTPKWIFLALNAPFQTRGSNTSLLGISTWPGISKRHLKINTPTTEFLIPCPENKRIHQFLPPPSSLSKWHYHPLICSSQKPVSSLTRFALLFISNRSASSTVSLQKLCISSTRYSLLPLTPSQSKTPSPLACAA